LPDQCQTAFYAPECSWLQVGDTDYDLVGVNWLEGGINLDKQSIDATAGLRKPLLSNGEKLHV